MFIFKGRTVPSVAPFFLAWVKTANALSLGGGEGHEEEKEERHEAAGRPTGKDRREGEGERTKTTHAAEQQAIGAVRSWSFIPLHSSTLSLSHTHTHTQTRPHSYTLPKVLFEQLPPHLHSWSTSR